ncbi:MAG: RNA polymerase sigma factor [Alistipes sp.]|nr:RNA polymerase sigma factor [Alistipes sp.]
MQTDPDFSRFAQGERGLFRVVYDRYIHDLYSYGRGLCYSHDNCLDAIQDVFTRIYGMGPEELARISNIRYYLLRSMRNRLTDISRRSGNLSENIEDHPFIADVSVATHEMDSMEEDRLLAGQVRRLLELLTPRQREAVYLRFMQEMEYEQIADILKMEPGSVRTLVFRGIARIRSCAPAEIKAVLTLSILAGKFF